MPSPLIEIAMTTAGLALATVVLFLIYIVIRYSPIVGRVFEEKPMFFPLRVTRADEGEDVTFPNRDGLTLAGTYLKSRTARRTGVIVFCHEYLSDRWGVLPYADHLRDHGFDLFCFDYRNHGKSETVPGYSPLQWVTDYEVTDVQAALAYVKSRDDADPAGVGLFGISRGGGSALCAAAKDPGVWGVVTDGAFPTRSTMESYVTRWAEIYVSNPHFWKLMPKGVFHFICWAGRVRTQRKLGCHYPDVETAVKRMAPRPWLAIHGQKDAYIGVSIAQTLFAYAGEPKELWVVPTAKHNRCREKEPAAYAERVAGFFNRFAPRRPNPVVEPARIDLAPALAFDAIPSPMEVAATATA